MHLFEGQLFGELGKRLGQSRTPERVLQPLGRREANHVLVIELAGLGGSGRWLSRKDKTPARSVGDMILQGA